MSLQVEGGWPEGKHWLVRGTDLLGQGELKEG